MSTRPLIFLSPEADDEAARNSISSSPVPFFLSPSAMAARPPPWPLLMSLLAVFSLVPFSSSSPSLSQSFSSPQNIQTFYPFIPPQSSPSPSPPRTNHFPPRQQVNTHSYRKVVKAVVATATGTALVSALFFFLLVRHINKKKQKLTKPNADPIPDILRVNSAVEGLILDEDGLDMLYWNRLLKGGKIRSTFNKHLMCSNFVKDEEKRENSSVPMQERPLLSERDTVALSPAVEKKEESTTISQPPLAPPPPPAPKIPIPPPPIAVKGPVPSLKPLPPAARTESAQVKMKPLHWDKVNPHNVDHSMVWHGIEKGSFK